MLIALLPATAWAELTMERSDAAIVITSQAGATWKIVLAVSPEASMETPGGGTIRALHIPADNPESVVETDPRKFGFSGWGLDHLEWRYIPAPDKSGVRAGMGTDAKINSLKVLHEAPDKIIIETKGQWRNVPSFTRTTTIDPRGVHTRLSAEWAGPDERRGMWWLMSLFKSEWLDSARATISDGDTASVPLPLAKENVFSLPTGISFPYEVRFPLERGPTSALRLNVAAFGTEDDRGLKYEFWPDQPPRNPDREGETFAMFYPRWVARPMEHQTYVFDYYWKLVDSE